MIASSLPAKVMSFIAACALLLAGLNLSRAAPSVELEGAGEVMDVQIGTSFEAMSAGTLTAQNPTEITEQTEPEPPIESEPPRADATAEPTPTPADQPTETALAKLVPTPTHAPAHAPALTPALTPAQSLAPTEVPALEILPDAAIPLSATPQPAADQATAAKPLQPTPPKPPLETLTASDADTAAPRRSARPQLRDPDKAPKPAPKPKAVAKKQPVKKKPAAKATRQGNADRNNRTGSETGNEQSKVARTQGASGQKSAQAGNAAASNYPGKVMRKISRVPRPRIRARGAAVVAFTISGSGRLAALRLARSSGSDALDKAALAVVQRAQPLPRPPAGAQRQFSIQIKGR